MEGYVWRLKYFHPSMLAFASGGNLIAYLYDNQVFNLILGLTCLAAVIWVVSGNIEDDKNGI